MKLFLCVSILAAVAMAEPPRFRQQSRFFARQQEETTPAPAGAPYSPSGWKPSGRAFELPKRQVQDTYGAPEPPAVYGPPSTTEAPTTAAPEEPTTVPPSEAGVNEFEEDGNQEEQQGEYYIALPDGRLQRVQYASREDAAKMRYLAKIEARNVGPIYAYSPLQKLELVRPVEVETPLAVIPIASASGGTPVSTSYTTVTTNFQPGSGKLLLAAV